LLLLELSYLICVRKTISLYLSTISTIEEITTNPLFVTNLIDSQRKVLGALVFMSAGLQKDRTYGRLWV